MATIYRSKLWKALSPDQREALNRRIEAGESGATLLPWLSDVCGEVVNDENLSQWRKGPFADWKEHQGRLELMDRMATRATAIANAAGGDLFKGLSSTVAGLMFELADSLTAGDLTLPDADAEGSAAKGGAETLISLGKAVATMQSAEQKGQALELQRQAVALKERELALKEDALKLRTAEALVAYHARPDVQAILSSGQPKERQVVQLTMALYGEDLVKKIRGEGGAEK